MEWKKTLTQAQVENVIARTRSNKEAAEFLGITLETWRRYAKIYFHRTMTDTTLYDYHTYYSAKDKGITSHPIRNVPQPPPRYDLNAILRGEHPEYKPNNLKRRVINNAVFPECCNFCGYSERRISDYTIPLLLHYKDNNLTNHRKENLELLCYNCFYILVGNFRSAIRKGKKLDIDAVPNT